MNRNDKLLEIRKIYAKFEKTILLEMLMSHINKLTDAELEVFYTNMTSPNTSNIQQVSQKTEFKADF